jgi:hypothetical protein
MRLPNLILLKNKSFWIPGDLTAMNMNTMKLNFQKFNSKINMNNGIGVKIHSREIIYSNTLMMKAPSNCINHF